LPTAFTVLTGSSNQFVTLGTSAVPIAACQFTLNTQASAGTRLTLANASGWWMNAADPVAAASVAWWTINRVDVV
jgi:hypothetical protein